MNVTPLPEHFYEHDTLTLAKLLLGKIFIKQTDKGMAAGWIVETEAYIGPMDRAAHSFQNKRTKRTEIMFGPPRFAYTYVMHTHCLVNVVSGKVDHPEAVLIRAVEPCYGIDLMYKRRPNITKQKELSNGPGKLTIALGIDRTDYGRTFFHLPLMISEGKSPSTISTGTRIGIENSGEAKSYPWRFWITENEYVSR